MNTQEIFSGDHARIYSATTPTRRTDGTALKNDDEWIDQTNHASKIFNGTDFTSGYESLGNLNVGTLDVDPTAQIYCKGLIKHHSHASTGDYAYQLRTESNHATKNYFGMDCEAHQMLNRTAGGVRGLSMTGRVATGVTLSGTSSLIPGYFNLDVDGTLNGTGLHAALYSVVSAGGTFTAVGHLASLWVDSQQEGTVTGEHELIYMTNNGASTMDQAFYIYGGNKIGKLFELNTCGGGMVGAKVDADIAYAHYRKVAVSIDGVAGWILVGSDT